MQGDLFHAHAHIRPRRANFFAHKARQRSDVETTNTTARPQQGSLETGITSTPENCTKNAHFSPAKAMAVSIPHEHKRAKAMAVSDNRTPGSRVPAAPPAGINMPAAPKLACNSIGRGFNKGQKRCNPNVVNSWFEGSAGELHAKLIRTRRRRYGGRRRAQLQHPWAAETRQLDTRTAPRRNSTPHTKTALGPCGTKLALHASSHRMCGTKLALLAQNGPNWHVLRAQGELYTAVASKKPRRANFIPHARQRRG